MLLLLFRLTTPVDQPGQQDASDVKQQKDFHGAHRRAGQGQRGAKRFWNKEAAHSANSGDKTERGGGIRHRFALRLLIAPAAIQKAKAGCPVSQVLNAEITLDYQLNA